MKKRVVLAFSGGLDTSFCVKYLSEELAKGIDMVLRVMGPQVIAMDEVTSGDDCLALTRAAWCGVDLLATAHASSVRDLMGRTVYRPLVETGLFTKAVVLDRQRCWHMEEVGEW